MHFIITFVSIKAVARKITYTDRGAIVAQFQLLLVFGVVKKAMRWKATNSSGCGRPNTSWVVSLVLLQFPFRAKAASLLLEI